MSRPPPLEGCDVSLELVSPGGFRDGVGEAVEGGGDVPIDGRGSGRGGEFGRGGD